MSALEDFWGCLSEALKEMFAEVSTIVLKSFTLLQAVVWYCLKANIFKNLFC
jgi:hypothetical protein